MLDVWFYTVGSVLLVSLLSFVGILFISIDEKMLKKMLLFHGHLPFG